MQELLKSLFSRHYRDVYTYLYSLCRDPSLSEDLAAEVFLEAARSIGGFRGEADVKTWLFSIARHRWLTCLRRQKRTVETEMLREFYESPEKTPEEKLLERELIRRIHQLLEMEPQRTRSIVRLRLEGYSFYEIGEKLGISEGSARVIDFRAKEKIRKKLKEEGYWDA